MSKTPEQKIKWLILELDGKWTGTPALDYDKASGADIESAYEALVEADGHWDVRNETRQGEVETGIPCEYSRHYEAKSVASRMPDGSWVGWTYWYGGGKHGEPEAVDWMEYAYDLSVTEEEKTIISRTFNRTSNALESNK